MISVTCFGEILWDNFPSYRRIGGAPLNVALRMHSLGASVRMISRLGQDPDGEDILKYLQDQGLSTDLIQMDPEHKTGTVDVHLDETRTATYTINKPAAWDEIELTAEMKMAVNGSDVLIYGSLATRSQTSEETLKTLLKEANYKVFDMNLRPPHFDMDRLVTLLMQADLVKLNDEELDELAAHQNLQGTTTTEKIRSLSKKMPPRVTICVTMGPQGAQLFKEGEMYVNSGYQVKVADTVGAGDSFLAALCYQLLNKVAPQEALDKACAMGSLVASKEGAIPSVSLEEIESMIKNKT
ncbi:MAG: carbohydrate kinase [Lutimonas sp.]